MHDHSKATDQIVTNPAKSRFFFLWGFRYHQIMIPTKYSSDAEYKYILAAGLLFFFLMAKRQEKGKGNEIVNILI